MKSFRPNPTTQTCKLGWETNFLFQLSLSLRFLTTAPKKSCRCNLNRNQTEMNLLHCTSAAGQEANIWLRLKTVSISGWRNVSLIFTVCWTLMQNKEEVVFFCCVLGICCRQKREKQLKPGWTPASCRGHLFSANANKLLHKQFFSLLLLLLPPPLRFYPGGISTSLITVPWILWSGLFLSCAATGGCQQATTADTDGSPCLWWLPYVTSLSWVRAFLKKNVFFPSLISFSVSLFKTRRDVNVTAGEEGQMWRLVIYFISRWALRPSFKGKLHV